MLEILEHLPFTIFEDGKGHVLYGLLKMARDMCCMDCCRVSMTIFTQMHRKSDSLIQYFRKNPCSSN